MSTLRAAVCKKLRLSATASQADIYRAALGKIALGSVTGSAAPCGFPHQGGRCGGTEVKYSVGGGYATRECLKCHHRTGMDVSPDVERKIKTPDQWREWWSKVYGFGAMGRNSGTGADPNSHFDVGDHVRLKGKPAKPEYMGRVTHVGTYTIGIIGDADGKPYNMPRDMTVRV